MARQRDLTSFRARYNRLTRKQQAAFVASLSPAEALAFRYESDFWLRREQVVDLDPGWRYYVIRSGRGFGKTKAGACWVKKCIEAGSQHVAICGPTHRDVSQVMVPAIVAEYPPSQAPEYNETRGKLVFQNGATVYCYSSETEIRGPNIEKLWCDELAKWYSPDAQFDVLNFAVRIGVPQILITTTPKKDIKTLRKLEADSLLPDTNVRIVRGNTFANSANLPASYLAEIRDRYEGSRLYRQEVEGELLDDAEDALWSFASIHQNRIKGSPGEIAQNLARVVVSVDPAGTANPDSDETGIVVAGISRDGYAYVLEDASGRFSPNDWARQALDLYRRYGAQAIVAEVNYGGDMVRNTIHTIDPTVHVKVNRATHSKLIRAEPIAAKYAQGRVRHVNILTRLEDQMCMFTGAPSTGKRKDDRLDALVWALHELLITHSYVRRDLTYLPHF